MDSNDVSIGMEDSGTNGYRIDKDRRTSTMSFHNIHYHVMMKSGLCCKRTVTQKDILFNLNGLMQPGLNAILGPTGSGKSSFLDVLAARKDPAGLTGDVLVDGVPQPDDFKYISGYVVQDDVVMGTLTVRENMNFSAELRLPDSVTRAEKAVRVDRLLEELGLTKVADSRVGTPLSRGISGGERKRVSIGMELITNPSVLFLDEPTTGLDASTANSVLHLLKRISSHGRIIIMSIHQPRYSIFRLFDTMTLLVSGKMVYHGPAQSALEYFSDIGYVCDPHNNPADFFLDILNGDAQSKNGSEENVRTYQDILNKRQEIENNLVEEYKNSDCNRNVTAQLDRITQDKEYFSSSNSVPHKQTSFFHQSYWVFRRTFQDLMMNPQSCVAEVLMNTLLAIIVGVIYFHVKNDKSGIQNRSGALFFIAVNLCFTCLSSAELLINERKLFLHEYISGYYRLSVYFLAKLISQLTVRTLSSFCLAVIVYFMIGFKETAGNFFIFLLSTILASWAATSMTLAVAVNKSSVAYATILVNLIYISMMMFSGFLVNLPSVMGWLSWVKYFSITYYAFTAMEINEFVGLTFCENDAYTNATMAAAAGITCTGEQHLAFMGMNHLDAWVLWQNEVALIILFVIFSIIVYLKLRFVKKFT